MEFVGTLTQTQKSTGEVFGGHIQEEEKKSESVAAFWAGKVPQDLIPLLPPQKSRLPHCPLILEVGGIQEYWIQES